MKFILSISLSFFIFQKAFPQNNFKIQQEKILKQAMAFDSAVYQVVSIEFKKVKFNRSKITMTYELEKGKVYTRTHKISYRKAGKVESIRIFFSITNDRTNWVTNDRTNWVDICKIKKINGAYWYVEVGPTKLLVDKYLSLMQKNEQGIWLKRHYYNY